MSNIDLRSALKERIVFLELQQHTDLSQVKSQFHHTYESLNPINLIKNTFHEVISSPDIKKSIFNNVIGLATGYLSKKVLIGGSHNPIKRVLGTVLEFVIANVVTKKVAEVNHEEKIN